ncbi:MAG: flagellar biosynthetic protein FliO [Pseudomonadota bacterium]
MSNTPDIWFAFARTFGMLFFVLALLIFAFYLVKKFSQAKGVKGHKDFIKILSVHHLSPKEKLVLLDVLGQTLLVGVTPSNISKISSIDQKINLSDDNPVQTFQFSDFLAKKLGRSLQNKDNDVVTKEQNQ